MFKAVSYGNHLISSIKQTFNVTNKILVRLQTINNESSKNCFSTRIEQSMETDSEYQSHLSSIAHSSTKYQNQLKFNSEHLVKRVHSLTQQHRVLQIELQTLKLPLKASQQQIKQLKLFGHLHFYK